MPICMMFLEKLFKKKGLQPYTADIMPRWYDLVSDT